MLFRRKSDAEKAREQRLKTLERAVKTQQKEAAKAQKQQQKALKQQQQAADKARKQQRKQQQQVQKQAERAHKKLVKLAVQASKRRKKAAKRAERQRQKQQRRLSAPPPFKKSKSCFVCGKGFKSAPHRRRHHCRQCRESCCLTCTSAQRRHVPPYTKPQKVCVVCDVMAPPAAAETGPRDPAEALAGLAARRPVQGRRPSSAPLPATDGVAVSVPRARRARSVRGKWTLPIRPLLRKRSAPRRKMDLDLLLEKQAMQAGRAIELQPQAA